MTGSSEMLQDPEGFTIVVRDRTFKLSKPQIECSSPNYFTSRFFDTLGQRKIQVLELSRDPLLFEIVLRYLNGYQVFPIHPSFVPPYHTPETVLVDLRADAEFYQLDGLARLCSSQAEISATAQTTAPRVSICNAHLSTHYAAITGHVYVMANKFQLSEGFDACIPRFAITLLTEKQCKAATSSEFLTALSAREDQLSDRRPDLLVVTGWSERIARAVIKRDTVGVNRWELIGWKRDVADNLRHVAILVKMWVEPGFEIVH